MLKVLNKINEPKDLKGLTIDELNTLAEENKENWHWTMPFDRETGKTTVNFGDGEDYLSLTSDLLLDKMQKDNTVVAVAAGVSTSFGFTQDKRIKAGKQFVDVGIAEEHAVALISGIAKNGGKPVFGEMISRYYGLYNMKVKNLGMKKEFYDRYDAQELLENLGITPEKIMEEAKRYTK